MKSKQQAHKDVINVNMYSLSKENNNMIRFYIIVTILKLIFIVCSYFKTNIYYNLLIS